MKAVLVGMFPLRCTFQLILLSLQRSKQVLHSLILQTEAKSGTLTIRGQIGDLPTLHSTTNPQFDSVNDVV